MSDFEIGVLGAGAWGTALAVLVAKQGRKVALWARDAERAAVMEASRLNPRLPGVVLPDSLRVSYEFPDAQILLVCVPMQHLRGTLLALPQKRAVLVLCCKGLEQNSLLLPPELVESVLPGQQVAMLTGPNFADEIAAGLPAASVLAATDAMLRADLMAALRSDTLRLYGSADVLGAALGGAAKNVVAIASGVVMGAGLGENARAALITRGIAEIARLAVALGGKAETVSGLSGLGDLLLTCTGTSSRNYSLGTALGKGEALAAILQSRTSVTEGVATAPALLARAKAVNVEMPITEAVTALLAGRLDVAGTMRALMGRALRDE
ncbi:MAG: glycerol-3-phosphate dehydrogenase [Acidocella sp. 20-57-95]|nr:MAG: glycerol-3-phosphate dehydrogenase [Acidocella sp. 20-57-95]OYV59302.1 MAG: glycerol-3-phosphate dehydrogenase [Acidocella sp. 21-58-7]HQT62997.1 NAD(P)H-dependent glycerol-3-phosphate dehydrogenase [Acidocella sp.]HQU03174.1 NAD(P)H-dependent glycerol-3-phosphate dehydrogenase [Acidocella sp.]